MDGRNNNHRYFRTSVRSKGSSSASDADPREKIKDCCRKFVAFMCTQVGVGGLVVCYALIGASSFSALESASNYSSSTAMNVSEMRTKYAHRLWQIVKDDNVFDKTRFVTNVSAELYKFQIEIVGLVHKGYNTDNPDDLWSFSAALMFSLSIITMIGYGNLVPKTKWGKFATVVYAIFGIPLYILYFLNMGKVLASCFRWIYTWLYACSTERGVNNEPPRRIIVPPTACLWVIGGYILTGAIMFAEWEHWSYLDSTYFCITSLCKLGLGDFVPGVGSNNDNQIKLISNFIYMLVGLGIVAMCYNLMRETISVKVQELREDFRQCLEDTRVRLMGCCRRIRGRNNDDLDDEY